MRNRPIPHVSAADKAFVQGLIVYQDAALLVFDKPSGLPVQSRGNKARCLDELLWAFARSNGKRPRLVHRIDAGTSGLVMAAKTKPVAAYLSGLFENRQVQKVYQALIPNARNLPESGMIDAAFARQSRKPSRAEIAKPGTSDIQAAKTSWRVLVRAENHAWLEVRPETGRMHQIRAHLAHIGCPIVGDPLYGGDQAPRLMLHAASLSFPMPDGQTLTIEAPVPDAFSAHGETLGL